MKYVFYILLSIIISFSVVHFFVFVISFIYLRFVKNIKPIKNETNKFRESSIFKKIFIDFPFQFVYDKLTFNPNTFNQYGLHLFCGEQGSGKSMLMTYMIRKYKTIFPRLVVRTNFGCKFQDAELNDWHELTLNTNGIFGELDCIDEIQNWFSTNASRNFPADMLTIVTQQRKVRRCIFATSQVFTRISKQLRENTYLMYYPFTLFGCVTFVRVYRPYLDSEGNLKEKKLQKFFFFVHDKELREAYDSYKTICTLSNSGFVDTKEIVS